MQYLFTSERLGFRNWLDQDLIPFSEMNKDERVMEFLMGAISCTQSKEQIEKFKGHFNDFGYTYFAVCELESDCLIGFIGLRKVLFESEFTPCVDIGWRLAHSFWGKGYATEGARKVMEKAKEWGIQSIYSFTSENNRKSERVMQKSGMKHVGYFDHPQVEDESNLKKHVLYKIDVPLWNKSVPNH